MSKFQTLNYFLKVWVSSFSRFWFHFLNQKTVIWTLSAENIKQIFVLCAVVLVLVVSGWIFPSQHYLFVKYFKNFLGLFLRHICIRLIRRNPNVVSDQCNGHVPPSNQIQRNRKLLENSAICFNQITHLTVNGPRSLTFGDLHLKFMSSILSEVLVKFRRPFLSNDSIVT